MSTSHERGRFGRALKQNHPRWPQGDLQTPNADAEGLRLEDAAIDTTCVESFEDVVNSAVETLRRTLLSEHRRTLSHVASEPTSQQSIGTMGSRSGANGVAVDSTPTMPTILASDAEELEDAADREAATESSAGTQDSEDANAAPCRHDSVTQAKRAQLSLYARSGLSLSDFKRQHRYDLAVTGLLVANAVWLGIETLRRTRGSDDDWINIGISLVFCVLFAADIAWCVRLERAKFFTGKERWWNWFFVVVVAATAVDLAMRILYGEDRLFFRQLPVFRILRLTRLFRIAQGMPTLVASHDFRLLIYSIRNAMAIFFYVVLVYACMLYVFGIGLAQAAVPSCGDVDDDSDLCKLFGTIPRSCMTLYMATHDGLLWGEVMSTIHQLNFAQRAIFLVLVSFVKIIVANMVAAILFFILQRTSETEREAQLSAEINSIDREYTELRHLFQALDLNTSGAISRHEFELAIQDPKVETLFGHLKINTANVYALFELLNDNGDGVIDIDEFIDGIQRLRGEAREIDVIVIQNQCSKILRGIQMLTKDSAGMGTGVEVDVARRHSQRHGAAPQTVPHSPAHPTAAPFSGALGAYSLQAFFSGRRPRLDQPEMRAMTLFELRQIRTLVNELCPQERWTDNRSGDLLTPSSVNLYHFTHHYICPRTAPSGVTLYISGCSAAKVGSRVVQVDERGACLMEGVVVEMTALGPRVQLQKGCYKNDARTRLLAEGIDIGQPSGCEAPGAISYKELVSSTPTRPTWFCSHWWGGHVIDMVECCETHTRLRKIDTTQASYWICGYANRQHSLESEIGDDPEQSSFRKAMNLADGVLLLLDENATPFTRIWCDFEVFCAVNDVEKGLDIMAKRRGVPQLLSDRQLPNETARAQTQREAKFPIALLVNGMHARLQDGETSKPSDKEAILQYVCQNSPDQEEILRRTNNTLHAIFAKSAWPQAVKRGLVEDFDRKNPGALRLPDVLRQNELQQSLHMSLEHMDMVTDAEVANIAAALPPNLSDLELSFEGCRNVSSRGLEAIALALPPRMRKLKLDFLGCSQMGDLGLRALAQQLPGQLQDLELHFDMCDNISIEGLRRLADGIPRCVRTFEGTFRGTQIDRNFASVRALQAFVDPGR